jgi:hypothetical protein
VASVLDLEGAACPRTSGVAGEVNVSINPSTGQITMTCDAVNQPPIPGCDDDFPTGPVGAFNLGSFSGDTSNTVTLTASGATCDGDQDWFVFRVTENDLNTPIGGGARPLVFRATLTSLTGDSDLCLYREDTLALINCSGGSGVDVVQGSISDTMDSDSASILIKVSEFTPGSYQLDVRRP